MRGFTLAELLIVVAIIAVLVAIAIPVFTKQLEKSRESVDFSNMRSAYAEVMVAAISGDAGSPLRMADGKYQARITLKQRQEDWQTAGVENMKIGGVPYDKWDSKMPAIGGTATVTYSPDSDDVIIDWSGNGSGSGSSGDPEDTPSLHSSVKRTDDNKFERGDVIQDDTGTCVILSGRWVEWNDYKNGVSVADLASRYSEYIVPVASDVKDSMSETLEPGDVCYDSSTKKYYYVDKIDLSGVRPNDSWIELRQ